MKYCIQKEHHKHLIILIHGLNGDENTWQGTKERFVEVLSQNYLVQENFDLALFTYGTKIFEVSWLSKISSTIKGFVNNQPGEAIEKFNVGIESISRPLETEISEVSGKYDSITLITHSMGGLVAKSAMTWLDEKIRQKIKLFISLSVPHIGAPLAHPGSKILLKNPQIEDLKVLGAFTTQLNERFGRLTHLPKMIYQSGNQDTVVPRGAAIPPNTSGEYIINTADNHFSVLLIRDSRNNTIFNRIINELHLLLQSFNSVVVAVIQNTPFGFLIETMAAKFNISIDLSCFTEEELSVKLRAETVNSLTVEDFFLKLRSLSVTPIPPYTVKRSRK
jgi:pimeloyl-ACP methyl ester carboxylesterase